MPRPAPAALPPLPFLQKDNRVPKASEIRQKIRDLRSQYEELLAFHDKHNLTLGRTTVDAIAAEDSALLELEKEAAKHVSLRERLAESVDKIRAAQRGFDELIQNRQFDDLVELKFSEEVTLMIVGFQLVHLGHLDAVFGVNSDLKKQLGPLLEANTVGDVSSSKLTERLINLARSNGTFEGAIDKPSVFAPATEREADLQARLETASNKVHTLQKQLESATSEAADATREKNTVNEVLSRLKGFVKRGVQAEARISKYEAEIRRLQQHADENEQQVAHLQDTIMQSQELQGGLEDDGGADDDNDDDADKSEVADVEGELVLALRDEIDTLKDQILAAEKASAKHDNTVRELRETLETVRADNAKLIFNERKANDKRLEAIQAVRENQARLDEIESLKRDNRALDKNLADTERTVTLADTETSRLRGQVDSLEDWKKNADEMMQRFRIESSKKATDDAARLRLAINEKSKALEEVATFRKQVDTVRAEAFTKTAELQKKLTDADKKMMGLQQQLVDAGQKATDLQQQLVDAGQKATNLQQQLVDDGKKAASLQQQLTDADQKVIGLQQQLVDAGQKIFGLQHQLVDAGQKIFGLQQQLADADKKLDGLQQQFADADQQAENLREQLTDAAAAAQLDANEQTAKTLQLEKQVTDAVAATSKLREELATSKRGADMEAADLKQKLSDAKAYVTSLHQEAEKVKKIADEAASTLQANNEQDLATLRTSIKLLDAAKADIETQVSSLQRDSSTAASELNDVSDKLRKQTDVSASLRQNVANIQAAKSAADDEISELKRAKETVDNEVVKLRDDLSNLETRSNASRVLAEQKAAQSDVQMANLEQQVETARLEVIEKSREFEVGLSGARREGEVLLIKLLRRSSSQRNSEAWDGAVRDMLKEILYGFGPVRAINWSQTTPWVGQDTLSFDHRFFGSSISASTVALELADSILSKSSLEFVLLNVWALRELLRHGHRLSFELASRLANMLVDVVGEGNVNLALTFASWQLVLELSRWPTVADVPDRFLAVLPPDAVVSWVFAAFRNGPDALLQQCRTQESSFFFEREQVALVASKNWELVLSLNFSSESYWFVSSTIWQVDSFVILDSIAEIRRLKFAVEDSLSLMQWWMENVPERATKMNRVD
ncbi:hypothetical protein ACHAQH_007984 [Verticillium albo-atrum]